MYNRIQIFTESQASGQPSIDTISIAWTNFTVDCLIAHDHVIRIEYQGLALVTHTSESRCVRGIAKVSLEASMWKSIQHLRHVSICWLAFVHKLARAEIGRVMPTE